MLNIQTREDFDSLLNDFKRAELVVIDTETNGLKYYRGNKPISISFYFPEWDKAYNFPFAHGVGKIDIRWNAANPKGTAYEAMKWAGNAKRDALLARLLETFEMDWGNCPKSWLKELKPIWDKPTHVYHNAKFDMHMMASIGFPVPTKMIDTLLLLHIVYPDWAAIDVDAPYTEKGVWARDESGRLLKKKQMGNRQLKWQAARLGLPDATTGEEELLQAAERLEATLAEYAISLGYDSKSAHRVKLDKKAHMWLLSSHDVAYYAMMDVKLTWQLYQWIKPIIEQWDNSYLEETFLMSQQVAFFMEQNGFVLDVETAKQRIKDIKPQLEYLEGLFDFKLGNPKALLEYLNSGVLATEPELNLPEWFPENKLAGTKLYPETVLKSTEATELEKVADHLIVRVVAEYRQLKKTRDTYLVKWLKARDKNGIVRGNVNVDGTKTGRTASSGDAGNLQNIPDRKGYRIKEVIVPPSPDWYIFGIDYGQLEGRLASWVAEELLVELGVHNLPPTMINLFNGKFSEDEYPTVKLARILKDGAPDLHKFTREILEVRETLFHGMTTAEILTWFGYNPSKIESHEDKIDAECRQIAKTINFGLLYSGTKFMLSKQLRIDLDAADVLVQRWRKIFPAFAIAQSYFTEQALTRRPNPTKTAIGAYVTQPISGRHLKYQLHSTWRYDRDEKRYYNLQEASAKKAWNGIVQGLGGWMTPVSYGRFRAEYGDEGIKPFAIIHDSIDGYIHKDFLWKLEALMEHMINFDVNPKLNVELQLSRTNWQDLKTVEANWRETWSY